MDPATLYLLYKLHNGPESIREFPFNSPAECETFRKAIPSDVEVIRYSCEKYTKGSARPRWYEIYDDQKVIRGVPVLQEDLLR